MNPADRARAIKAQRNAEELERAQANQRFREERARRYAEGVEGWCYRCGRSIPVAEGVLLEHNDRDNPWDNNKPCKGIGEAPGPIPYGF
jgi:hypothetical protein